MDWRLLFKIIVKYIVCMVAGVGGLISVVVGLAFLYDVTKPWAGYVIVGTVAGTIFIWGVYDSYQTAVRKKKQKEAFELRTWKEEKPKYNGRFWK